MAKIRIYRDEASGEELPRSCIRCGIEAETDTVQKFTWLPSWVHVLILAGLGPWLIVGLILRKSMSVTLPVCHRHRNHWLRRQLFTWLGFLGWILLGIALIPISDSIPKDMKEYVLAAYLIGVVIWLIAAVAYTNSAIKASVISDRWIELVGVDKGFVAEWQDILDARSEKRALKRREKRSSSAIQNEE